MDGFCMSSIFAIFCHRDSPRAQSHSQYLYGAVWRSPEDVCILIPAAWEYGQEKLQKKQMEIRLWRSQPSNKGFLWMICAPPPSQNVEERFSWGACVGVMAWEKEPTDACWLWVRKDRRQGIQVVSRSRKKQEIGFSLCASSKEHSWLECGIVLF